MLPEVLGPGADLGRPPSEDGDPPRNASRNAASPSTSTSLGVPRRQARSSRSDRLPRTATSPLWWPCRHSNRSPSTSTNHSPSPSVRGGGPIRLIGSPPLYHARRLDVEPLVDAVGGDLAVDRVGAAHARCSASQRCTATSMAWRRSQNRRVPGPAKVQHGSSRSLRPRPSIRSSSPSVHPGDDRLALVGPRAEPGVLGVARRGPRRPRPPVDPADVGEQLTRGPSRGTSAPCGRGRRRGCGEPVAVATQRIEVARRDPSGHSSRAADGVGNDVDVTRGCRDRASRSTRAC